MPLSLKNKKHIRIIGTCGAGKSTLARRLGQKLGLPVIHMDKEFWEPGWVQPDKETWRKRLQKLITQPKWIMDGNYGNTSDLHLPVADFIIFMAYHPLRGLWRVIKRRLFSRTPRTDIPAHCPNKVDTWFVFHTLKSRWRARRRFFDDNVKHIVKKGQYAILRNDREVEDFLREIK